MWHRICCSQLTGRCFCWDGTNQTFIRLCDVAILKLGLSNSAFDSPFNLINILYWQCEVFDDLKRSPWTSFDFILHFRSSTYSTSNMSVLQSAASGMHQMAMMDGRGGAMLPPPPHLQYPSHNSTASQQSAQQPKYPPPLIPVNGSNQRWETFYFSPGASFGNWNKTFNFVHMQNSYRYKPKGGWFLKNLTKRIQFKLIYYSMIVANYKPDDDSQLLSKALANYKKLEIFMGLLIKVVIFTKLVQVKPHIECWQLFSSFIFC